MAKLKVKSAHLFYNSANQILRGLCHGYYNTIFTSNKESHWKYVRKLTARQFCSKQTERMSKIAIANVQEWIQSKQQQGLADTLQAQKSFTFDPNVEMTKIRFSTILQTGLDYTPTDDDYTTVTQNLHTCLFEYA